MKTVNDSRTGVFDSTALLRKFNEDQERDDHGRWSAGGSGLGGTEEGKGRTGAQKEIESKFRAQLNSMSMDQLKAAYAQRPDAEGGKVLNTDVMRELSADYLADRSQSQAVHEPSSAAIKAMYADRLAQEPGKGEQPLVLFTAGGTGSGKSSAIAGDKNLSTLKGAAQMVYDGNMNNYSSAKSKVEQALGSGKSVVIAYVYRDPVDAMVNGALKRATGQEGNFGSGRTVPVAEHVATHIGSQDVVSRLQKEYATDARVRVMVIDNSKGSGNSHSSRMSDLPHVKDSAALERTLHERITEEYHKGKISGRTYTGFTTREPPARKATDGQGFERARRFFLEGTRGEPQRP